jgi:hypothetical protein
MGKDSQHQHWDCCCRVEGRRAGCGGTAIPVTGACTAALAVRLLLVLCPNQPTTDTGCFVFCACVLGGGGGPADLSLLAATPCCTYTVCCCWWGHSMGDVWLYGTQHVVMAGQSHCRSLLCALLPNLQGSAAAAAAAHLLPNHCCCCCCCCLATAAAAAGGSTGRTWLHSSHRTSPTRRRSCGSSCRACCMTASSSQPWNNWQIVCRAGELCPVMVAGVQVASIMVFQMVGRIRPAVQARGGHVRTTTTRANRRSMPLEHMHAAQTASLRAACNCIASYGMLLQRLAAPMWCVLVPHLVC